MIDFEVLKKKCQQLPELKTLTTAQAKEEGVLKKLQDVGVEINRLQVAVSSREQSVMDALLDDPDGVNAIRKESARLKETLGDATYWRARIQAEALPTVRKELAAAERAYKASVKTLVLESAKEVSADVADAVESLYKMFLAWDAGLSGLYKTIDTYFPADEFRLKLENEFRERLTRAQCLGAAPYLEHLSRELEKATDIWNQMGALSQKKAMPEETTEPQQTEPKPEIISSNDAAYLTAK